MTYVLARAPAMKPDKSTFAGTGAVMVFSFAFRLPALKPKNAVTRLTPADHVVSTVHGTRTVLLDVRNGHYWGLDEVGTRIWTLAGEGLMETEIAERLAAEYQAEVAELLVDVKTFLNNLEKSKLLRRVA
ncbi:MAG TPA: PqqD family protein [Longimicrobiales bacterium]|nr:PqqD family protein [Longimicrobiales bacterium]